MRRPDPLTGGPLARKVTHEHGLSHSFALGHTAGSLGHFPVTLTLPLTVGIQKSKRWPVTLAEPGETHGLCREQLMCFRRWKPAATGSALSVQSLL